MAIPSARVQVLSDDGTFSLPWRRWAQELTGGTSGGVTPEEFTALEALVTLVEAQAAAALADALAAQQVAATAEIIALVALGDGRPFP